MLDIIEGHGDGVSGRERRGKVKLLDVLKRERRKYWVIMEEAKDRERRIRKLQSPRT